MRKYLVLIVLFLVLTPVFALNVIYDYSRMAGVASQLTTETHYDRNPSFFEASDGTYWLFFVRSQTDYNGYGCDESGGPMNCDNDVYDIYYITSHDKGETWSSPIKMSSPITNFCQRDIAAFQDDNGNIWVFTASGSCGSNSNIYYYKSSNNGGSWSGPTQVSSISGGHLDAIQDNTGTIWIFFSNGNTKYVTSSDYAASWTSSQVLGSSGAMPKVMEDSTGNLRVVWIESSGDGVYLSTYDGSSWSENFIVTSGIPNWGDYDPTIYQDSQGYYWVFFAPWDNSGGVNSQWIEYTYSPDGQTWSLPVQLTNGGYASETWWDMWPEVYETSEGSLLIFYTSEMSTGSSYQRGDGNIWMFKADISTETRFDYLTDKMINHEGRISFLETWRTSVKNTISNLIQRIEALEQFIESLSDQPQGPTCGNEICETWFNEDHSSCPEDCPGEVVDGEVFISDHWKAECPVTFNSYTIVRCRAETYSNGAKLFEEIIQVGKLLQVNYRAGYSIKLYGEIVS